jgi:hypothetical protein
MSWTSWCNRLLPSFMLLFEHCVMMSSYVTVVYVNCWSWHVHGSHSVCLLKPGVKATLLKNGERANISGCQFSFNPEPANTLHQWYFQVYIIVGLKNQRLTSFIRIVFLSSLSFFRLCLIRWTFSFVSLTKSGLKNHCSPGSDQFKGVRHHRPYRASNGAISMLSW